MDPKFDSRNLTFPPPIKNKLYLVGIFILILSACQTTSSAPVTPTMPQVVPILSATPAPVCTPLPCDTNESYYCPDSCPGGCGTVCATHTPTTSSVETNIENMPETTPEFATIRFAVIGDYGLAGEPLAGVATLVKSWQPDFIITTGDNNYPNGSADTIDENIGQYFHQFIYPYAGNYGAGAEINRFFPTLGNHDWDIEQAQAYFDYFDLPNNERYYDFVWGPVHFFALNSTAGEPDGVGRSSLQAAWLQESLAASTSPWKIVYFHHAPYSSGEYQGPTDWMQWPFANWGADAVLTGHDHLYERLLIDAIPYFIVGNSGFPNPYGFGETHPGSQARYRDNYGALVVEASESELTFVFETSDHEIIDAYQLQRSPQDIELGSEPLLSVQIFPDPADYHWMPVAMGLTSPVGLVQANDESGRLFIIEQPGLIQVWQAGQISATPFLNIRDRVNDQNNEQGLLGMAFHPDFGRNGYFYVNYTGQNGDTFISRFSAAPGAEQVDPKTEINLLRISQPYGNHNGGHLAFDSDGLLYIGTGDGGAANDPQGNAQNLNSLLGKMLRIDVDHGDPYAVPADNPYVAGGGLPQIWAAGLRNPWRYTFDRATGDLFIGDVGQNQWEEISILAADTPGGANFGWDFEEGFHPFEGNPSENVSLIPPIWEYDHSLGCSVTGGIVYRGSMPEWQGIYLYGDFCSGRVWGLLRDQNGIWQNQELYQTGANITSFGEDQTGEVYLVDRNGMISQLGALP
jgi:glucose/arabinose dehydrogenase